MSTSFYPNQLEKKKSHFHSIFQFCLFFTSSIPQKFCTSVIQFLPTSLFWTNISHKLLMLYYYTHYLYVSTNSRFFLFLFSFVVLSFKQVQIQVLHPEFCRQLSDIIFLYYHYPACLWVPSHLPILLRTSTPCMLSL